MTAFHISPQMLPITRAFRLRATARMHFCRYLVSSPTSAAISKSHLGKLVITHQ